MQTTIDGAGRVVIPKSIREELGLGQGGRVAVIVRDGRIEIEPVPVAMRLVDRGDGPVLEAEAEMPALSAEDVRSTLERLRR